jgi:hypothetical protein
MSAEEELYAVTRQIIERQREAATVSPTWIATHVMCEIRFKPQLHHLGYAGCHLQIRQMARQELRRKHDPNAVIIDQLTSGQDDFFPETLQDRYPRRTAHGEEPVYVLRDLMTDADVEWNMNRMRRGGEALLKHADALRAWHGGRRSDAA